MSDKTQTGQHKTVAFRGGGFAPKPKRWIGFVVFILLIGLLEIGTRTGVINNLTLPRPSDVFNTFVELWETGLLWKHLAPSLSHLAIGAAIGASFGIAVGISSNFTSFSR